MRCHAIHLMQFDIDYDMALLLRLCLTSCKESLILKAFNSKELLKKTAAGDLLLIDSLLCTFEGVGDGDSNFTLSLNSHEYDILTEAVRKEISICKLDILRFKLESLLKYMCP